MNKTIWMYWENKEGLIKPAYLELCLETIIKHSPSYKVIVLNEKTVYDYLPNLRNDLNRIEEIAHRADYIRANVIYEYGGIWLDSDVILLKEINIESHLDKYEYVGSSVEYGKPSIWFFGARKHCTILNKWIAQMDIKLDDKLYNLNKPKFKQYKYKYIYKTIDILNVINLEKLDYFSKKLKAKYNKKVGNLNSFRWSEIGYDILWKLFEGYDYYNIDFRKFAPIIWNKWEKFISNAIDLELIVKNDTIAVMLYNKFMYDPLKDMSKKELLDSNMLLSKIFRFSLGINHE